ncbi:MAG: TfoX/Sxy family protein [Geminicoccaceae bacterium]|nr:TfoX/Sxy family protein [Geminicoccaceae bacterium]
MKDAALLAHALALLGDPAAGIGPVRGRRMFGGHGIFKDDRMVALIADGRLYLKTDERTRPVFEAADSHAFTFAKAGRDVVTSYMSAPDEALDEAAAMAPWAERALEAATRAAREKHPKQRR